MKRVNYHTHTSYCRHAKGTVAEYAQEARKSGLEVLGFSDHIPYPGNPFGYRMDREDLQAYCHDVLAVKEKYKGEMTVYCGFESEYDREWIYWYEELYETGQCEYLLLGQHWFCDEEGRRWQTGNVPSTTLYPAYIRQVLEGMKTGLFQAVAHPDLIFMNVHAWDENCDLACDLLVEGCAKEGYLLEYNANGYRRGICEFDDGERFQYPHKGLWEKIAKTRIPVVVGSDCHSPGLMYDEFVKKAYREAKDMGLNLVTDIFNR